MSKATQQQRYRLFLSELVAVCRRHGLSLGHEDSQGAFVIHEYSDDNIDWLLDALIGDDWEART